MIKRIKLIARCSLLAPFFLQGCMLATQEDVMKLDENITQLRKNQADLVSKMTDLSGNLESVNSQLESSQQRMTVLSQKLDDIQADITRRMSVLSGQVTGTANSGPATPGDLFRIAYNDYQAGKFDLALVGFRNFLNQYPKADLASQAQFFAGESEFARKNYPDAAQEYLKVIQMYPRSDSVPKALYKRGLALQQTGDTDGAQESFKRLLKEYPHNELTHSARDILKETQ